MSNPPTLGVYAIADPEGAPPREVHDHAFALMQDGRLLRHAELERLTRRKHDNKLPDHLEHLLTDAGLGLPNSIRLVSVDNGEGESFATPQGAIAIGAAEDDAPGAVPGLRRGAGRCFDHEVEVWLCPHELAHVGSHLPFTGGFEDNALLVHIDGGASVSNVSAWTYRDGQIVHLHHSWGLKPAVSHFFDSPLSFALLGMAREDELALAGKLMGFAAHGRYDADLHARLKQENWFRDDDQWARFKRAAKDFGAHVEQFDTREPFLMDVAACMQRDLEDAVIDFLSRYRDRTGARHLYLSGGVALNILLNARIERTLGFDSLHVPPCCGDGGLALGAAALVEFLDQGEIAQNGPFVNDVGAPEPVPLAPALAEEVADRLARGQVVGLVDGPAEIGPRALGCRSLLAHPGSTALRDRLSQTMKKREWYRPVAPIALDRMVPDLFEGAAGSALSRFMLGAYQVKPDRRGQIPGVVHADGSARAQAVDAKAPGFEAIGAILDAAERRHGIPCLINTSFNRRGEPLVHTTQQAIEAGRAMEVDAVVVGGRLVEPLGRTGEVPDHAWACKA